MIILSDMKSGSMTLVKARHGNFLVLSGDQVSPGGSLIHYGEFCEHEIELLSEIVGPGNFVIEVGANIGTHTIPLVRRILPDGCYIAYEPQPIIATVLQANLALNGFSGVEMRVAAAGNIQGTSLIPIIDYTNHGNSGAVSMRLDPTPRKVAANGSNEKYGQVSVECLDSLPRRAPVTLIKIDAEDWEFEVLQGARRILKDDRPLVYFEQHFDDADNVEISPAMCIILAERYKLFAHRESLHRKGNYNNQQIPMFLDLGFSSNVLAIPSERFGDYKDLVKRHGLRPIRF